jgi:hypothetical protein
MRCLTSRLVNQQGLPRGEALVEFGNDSEASSAMSVMNKKPIGTRWIDIVPSTAGEIRAARSCGGLVPVGQSAKDVERYAGADYEYSTFQFGECWVKLRGLPYSITKKDVADFLLRASVIPVGIFLSEGIGYVELHSMAHVEAVLLLHKQKIGHRWVEVFHLSRTEAMSKAPQMQVQMQMQQSYSAMHMQQAPSSYSAYPYAASSSSWYPAPASPHYQSMPIYAASASQFADALPSGNVRVMYLQLVVDTAVLRRRAGHRSQNAWASLHVSCGRCSVSARVIVLKQLPTEILQRVFPGLLCSSEFDKFWQHRCFILRS